MALILALWAACLLAADSRKEPQGEAQSYANRYQLAPAETTSFRLLVPQGHQMLRGSVTISGDGEVQLLILTAEEHRRRRSGVSYRPALVHTVRRAATLRAYLMQPGLYTVLITNQSPTSTATASIRLAWSQPDEPYPKRPPTALRNAVVLASSTWIFLAAVWTIKHLR
jgi:hypothetical protein